MLGAIFAVATTTSAQTGQITGVVVDETGSVLAGVVVALTGPSFELAATTDGAGRFRFDNVVTGTYDLTARLSGFLDAVRASIAVSDGDVVAISPITLSLGVGEIVVVTAARTESALVDAPATMTVLPGRALEVGPALNYGDILRSVPGRNVVQMSTRDINLTIRQGTHPVATSQLALVDGRSTYFDFLGLVLWDFMPTNMADIRARCVSTHWGIGTRRSFSPTKKIGGVVTLARLLSGECCLRAVNKQIHVSDHVCHNQSSVISRHPEERTLCREPLVGSRGLSSGCWPPPCSARQATPKLAGVVSGAPGCRRDSSLRTISTTVSASVDWPIRACDENAKATAGVPIIRRPTRTL